MATSFQDIQAEAQRRWQAITAGDRPWIRVGTALCGKAAGCDSVLEALRDTLERRRVTANVSQVGCLGLCFAEPLVDVQFPGGPRIFYGNVTPENIDEIVASHVALGTPVPHLALGYLEGGDGPTASAGLDPGIPDLDRHPMRAQENRICPAQCRQHRPCRHLPLHRQWRLPGPGQCADRVEPVQTHWSWLTPPVCEAVAAPPFPTATKWRFLAGSNAPVKYILCNCEEGDPGAFNDKAILESDPQTLIEGIILCGYATGSHHGYIFIRHGHDGPIQRSHEAVRQAEELGLLGDDILGSGFGFHLEVALTGDSYVAGEESAMMDAIEGKRAMPRYRPPFPAQVGLFGKPHQHQQRENHWPMYRKSWPGAANGSPVLATNRVPVPPYFA